MFKSKIFFGKGKKTCKLRINSEKKTQKAKESWSQKSKNLIRKKEFYKKKEAVNEK